MKRNFCNTVTKRLISAFLVLAMVVTIIPVTDAEAKKKKNKYYRYHDFYTVDTTDTEGHREEIIDTEPYVYDDGFVNGTGLYHYYDGVLDTEDGCYKYSLNADEVRQLVAGKKITLHLDRFRVLCIDSNNTNVGINELFITMSYTDKKGKKKNLKCISAEMMVNCKGDRGCAADNFALDGEPLVTDATITLQLTSKKIYLENTRFELPKGDKGKKKTTYRWFVWTGNDGVPLTVDGKKQKLYGSEELCARNSTYVSFDGLEEPYEFYLGHGKWGWMPSELGADPIYQPVIACSRKELKKGEDVTIRGVYTHRKVKCHITYVTKRETGHLVYDKFKHKSKLAYSYSY